MIVFIVSFVFFNILGMVLSSRPRAQLTSGEKNISELKAHPITALFTNVIASAILAAIIWFSVCF